MNIRWHVLATAKDYGDAQTSRDCCASPLSRAVVASAPMLGCSHSAKPVLSSRSEKSSVGRGQCAECCPAYGRAAVDAQSIAGDAPLHAAADAGNHEAVQLLLEGRAAIVIDAQNTNGCTAVRHAANIGGNCETVQRLLEGRATLNAQDTDGYAALGTLALGTLWAEH